LLNISKITRRKNMNDLKATIGTPRVEQLMRRISAYLSDETGKSTFVCGGYIRKSLQEILNGKTVQEMETMSSTVRMDFVKKAVIGALGYLGLDSKEHMNAIVNIYEDWKFEYNRN
jgi:hypothetical protein